MKISLAETLAALAESQDPRLAVLYNGLLHRIRFGTTTGNMEEIMGCKAPGQGKHDVFGEFQAKTRNENLIKAVQYCAGNKPNKYYAAAKTVQAELARFRKKYPLIVSGLAIPDSELEHYLSAAAWVDPSVFDLKHGIFYKLVKPQKNLKKTPFL